MWIRGWSNSASLVHCCHGACVVKSSTSAVVTSAGARENNEVLLFWPWIRHPGQKLREWKAKLRSGWNEHRPICFGVASFAKFLPLCCNSLNATLWSTRFGYLRICSLTTLSFEFVFGAASPDPLSSTLVARGFVSCNTVRALLRFAYRLHENTGKQHPDHKLASLFTAFDVSVLKTATNCWNHCQSSESCNSSHGNRGCAREKKSRGETRTTAVTVLLKHKMKKCRANTRRLDRVGGHDHWYSSHLHWLHPVKHWRRGLSERNGRTVFHTVCHVDGAE